MLFICFAISVQSSLLQLSQAMTARSCGRADSCPATVLGSTQAQHIQLLLSGQASGPHCEGSPGWTPCWNPLHSQHHLWVCCLLPLAMLLLPRTLKGQASRVYKLPGIICNTYLQSCPRYPHSKLVMTPAMLKICHILSVNSTTRYKQCIFCKGQIWETFCHQSEILTLPLGPSCCETLVGLFPHAHHELLLWCFVVQLDRLQG